MKEISEIRLRKVILSEGPILTVSGGRRRGCEALRLGSGSVQSVPSRD